MVMPNAVYLGGVSGSMNEGGSSTCQPPLVSTLSAAMHVKTGDSSKGNQRRGLCSFFSTPALFLHIVFLLSSQIALQPAVPLKISPPSSISFPHLENSLSNPSTDLLIFAQMVGSGKSKHMNKMNTIKMKANTNVVLCEYISLF